MIRSLATIAVLVGGATGCDLVYGLTGREPAVDAAVDTIDADPCPNDVDCDFVGDPIDNCPDVANSDQDDMDGDDVGDVCDACLIKPSMSDEDGDGIINDVDNCPTVINSFQENADGDGVGDVCDPRPSIGGDTVACFMGFADADETRRIWSITAKPWVAQNGQIEHFQPDISPFVVIHQPSHVTAAGPSYELQTFVSFGGMSSASFQTGLGIGEPIPADRGVRCLLDGTFGVSASVTLLDSNDTILQQMQVPAFSTAQVRITLRIEPQGPTTLLTCSVAFGVSAPTSITANGPALAGAPTPRLISSNAYAAFPWLATYRLGP